MQLHILEPEDGTGPYLVQMLWGRMISAVIYRKHKVRIVVFAFRMLASEFSKCFIEKMHSKRYKISNFIITFCYKNFCNSISFGCVSILLTYWWNNAGSTTCYLLQKISTIRHQCHIVNPNITQNYNIFRVLHKTSYDLYLSWWASWEDPNGFRWFAKNTRRNSWILIEILFLLNSMSKFCTSINTSL